jgi:hypothetical protein
MARSSVLSSDRIHPELPERVEILKMCESKGITTSQALQIAVESGYTTAGNRNFVKRVLLRKREIDQEEWRYWSKIFTHAEFPSSYHLKRKIWSLMDTETLKAKVYALARDGNYFDSIEILQRELDERIQEEEDRFRVKLDYVRILNRFLEDYAFVSSQRFFSTSDNPAHRAYFACIAYGASLRITDFNTMNGVNEHREHNYRLAVRAVDSVKEDEETYRNVRCLLDIYRANQLLLSGKTDKAESLFTALLQYSEAVLSGNSPDPETARQFRSYRIDILTSLVDILLTKNSKKSSSVPLYLEKLHRFIEESGDGNTGYMYRYIMLRARYHMNMKDYEKTLDILDRLHAYRGKDEISSPYLRSRFIKIIHTLDDEIGEDGSYSDRYLSTRDTVKSFMIYNVTY